MNKELLLPVTISALAGGVIGGVITYIATNTALRKRYTEFADAEIDSVKSQYASLNNTLKANVFIPSKEETEEYEELADGNYGPDTISAFNEEDVQKHWPFTYPEKEDWGEDEEDAADPFVTPIAERTEDAPYLISEAEYFENFDDYALETLSYYEGDDTLADEHDGIIEDVFRVVGGNSLVEWPQSAPGEKSSLYIRHDAHETLYEVIRISGHYAQIILGMDEETLGIKPEKSRPKKMKQDDD